MNLLRFIFRLLGLVYGAIHFASGSSLLILTMQSPESADLTLLSLVTVSVIGTLSGYWVFRQRFTTYRWILITISLLFFAVIVCFGFFANPQGGL